MRMAWGWRLWPKGADVQRFAGRNRLPKYEASPGRRGGEIVGRSRRAMLQWTWVAAAVCALGAGCAKEGAPGGGPLDTSPPRIESHRPGRDELGVPRTTTVEIEFSEKPDRESAEQALVVLPAPAEPKLRWKGRRLLVEQASFPADETCVITVLSSCADKHGNLMGSPYSWAFSTGQTLPTGLLRVRLLTQDVPVEDGLVWLAAAADTSTVPVRVSQSDSSGVALVGWLPEGTYRVLAFRDANADLHYAFGLEEAAVDTIDVASGDTLGLEMALAVADTTPPRLVRAVAPSSRRIDLSFSEAVVGEGLFAVTSERGDSLPVGASCTDPEEASVVHLVLAVDMASVSYWVYARGLVDKVGLPLEPGDVVVEGTSDPDIVSPELRTVYVYADSTHADTSQIWLQIRAVWNEPVDVPEGTVLLRHAADGRVLAGKQHITNLQEAVFVASEPVAPEDYVVLTVAKGVSDFSGNVWGTTMSTLLGPEDLDVPVVALSGAYVHRGGAQ